MLNRLIAMESVLPHCPHKTGAIEIRTFGRRSSGRGWPSSAAGPCREPAAAPGAGPDRALRLEPVPAARLGDLEHHGEPADLVQQHRELSGERRLVVFVDYMQKVPQIPEPENETEKVTYIVQGLKDIALAEDVPTVSIVAADKEGLKASRLRNHHLRGSRRSTTRPTSS